MFVNDESIFDSCAVDLLLGVDGRDDEARDDGLDGFVADLLAGVLVDLAELGVALLLAALTGLTGVLNSCSGSLPEPTVKLNSLIGDTDDLLFVVVVAAVDFLAD